MGWRLAAAVLGIVLLLNGSLRMKDAMWPFGPMSQYAFSPPFSEVVSVTRVEGVMADGSRRDLPLRVGASGVKRADIDAQVDKIEQDPALLKGVVVGWSARHPGAPAVREALLVQDRSTLADGLRRPPRTVELAHWTVSR